MSCNETIEVDDDDEKDPEGGRSPVGMMKLRSSQDSYFETGNWRS